MYSRLRALKEWLSRPVAWGAVLLSYAGIVGAIVYGVSVGAYTDAQLQNEAKVRAVVLAREAHQREEQFCGVVINVHKNAKFRAATEQRRVEATADYLTDIEVPRDALYKRIAESLPSVRSDRDVARAAVNATEPPPICKKYERTA